MPIDQDQNNPSRKVVGDRVDAALPDFQTFRQPYYYQKLPLMVH